MALNNCVLGNTTICAEAPSESEVQNILQHLGVPSSNSQTQHQIQQHQPQPQTAQTQQRLLQPQQQQNLSTSIGNNQSQWRSSQQAVSTRTSGKQA